MILKENLEKIFSGQLQAVQESSGSMDRHLGRKLGMKSSHALIITGIRRCGKSTLLKQIFNHSKKAAYFNFEDPRLSGFESSDFEKLEQISIEITGKANYYLFDEIQNIPGWERNIRKMLDEGKKVILTGSNSSLLSKDMGVKLTGRHLDYELFPFSFTEMQANPERFPGIILKQPEERLNYYLLNGGFPEYSLFREPEILRQLFSDIVTRDVVVRHRLKYPRVINELAIYIYSNLGKELSWNSLKKQFNLGSPNTVIKYISFLEDCYLLFTVPRFNYSFKKQAYNPKKVYAIDTGLARTISHSFSEDKGRMLENLVYIHLRKKNKKIYYFREKNECDFIVRADNGKTSCIQVCCELNSENEKREVEGLSEAMKALNTGMGTIVTFKQKDKLKNIRIIPAYDFIE